MSIGAWMWGSAPALLRFPSFINFQSSISFQKGKLMIHLKHHIISSSWESFFYSQERVGKSSEIWKKNIVKRGMRGRGGNENDTSYGCWSVKGMKEETKERSQISPTQRGLHCHCLSYYTDPELFLLGLAGSKNKHTKGETAYMWRIEWVFAKNIHNLLFQIWYLCGHVPEQNLGSLSHSFVEIFCRTNNQNS